MIAKFKRLLAKCKTIPDSLKATLVFAISSFATSGINYITTPIFTRLLTSEQYGTVAVYNSWYSIIRVFASMTLIFPGVLNVGLYEHRDNRWKYLSSMLGLTTATTLILVFCYLLFPSQVETALALPTTLVVLILLMCLSQPATTFWTFKQRYEYRYKETFIISVGSALLAQILSIVVVLLAKEHGYSHLDHVRLCSAGLVNITVGLLLWVYIRNKGKKLIDFPLWKSTLLVSLPLIPHYLGSEMLSSIDKIMIDKMVGSDKAGIYSLAAILSSIGILLWRSLNVMFAPFVNEKLGQKNYSSIRKNTKPLLEMAGIMCILASLAAPEIIRILATEDYLQGVYVVPPIAAGVFLHALYDTYSAVSFFHKKSFYIMAATVTAAVVNLVLNYICILRFGYLAAGYTTLISNLVLVGMHYINVRRIVKEQVYDGKHSLLMISTVTVGCLLCNLLYDGIILRYLLIAALLALMFLRRKNFFDALISMKVK